MIIYKMHNFAVLLLCVFLCDARPAVTDTEDDGYSAEVAALFKDLKQYSTNVGTARNKMNKFVNETWDRKYAIGIINLYTQGSSFYSTLNREMRMGYPDNTTDIWRRSGDLINRGLDILGPTIYEKVYRGCSKLDNLPVAGKEYLFNHITSTSTNRQTAIHFISQPDACSKGMLFDIENVYGVSVEDYSSFSFEREVIIKSTNVFKVNRGPVSESKYNVFYLDGQPEVNKPHRANWHEINGMNRPEAILLNQLATVLLLLLYEIA